MSKLCLTLLVILSTICFSFNKALAASEATIVPVLSLLLTHKMVCAEANGLLWCRYSNLSQGKGIACNDVCAANGMTPVADDAAWVAAQDTAVECEAVKDAVGLSGIVFINNWTYGCIELAFIDFMCSTYNGCPAMHRTSSGGADHISICPCE